MTQEVVQALFAFSQDAVEKGRVRKKPRYRVKTMWEELERAAREKRKCMIRYKKRRKYGGGTSEYYVAPYSLRNKPGGPVLFAYDYVDGRIKSFFRDSITGVHVTNRKFRPKWEVEIGSGTKRKSMDIFDPFEALAEIVTVEKSKTETVEEFMNEGLSAERGVGRDDVDPEQLEMGIKVEMEHTNDPELSEKIALDHLAEFPDYYTGLAEMERKLHEKHEGKKEKTEKDAVGSPPAPKEVAGSPKPKIVKPSANPNP
jgi:predicted DNA-binding transcriptional regulator YafY